MSASQKTSLNVEVTTLGNEPESIDFTDVQFISFVNSATYGKPALIAQEEDGARAAPGSTVLFVNPANVAAVSVERVR